MELSKIINSFTGWLVAILLGIILIMTTINSSHKHGALKNNIDTINGKTYQIISYKHDTIYIHITKTVYQQGKTIRKDSIIYSTIKEAVDTQKILEDYLAYKIYSDTLNISDSIGYISILDTLNKNSIYSRVWNSHIKQMQIHDTLTLSPIESSLYLGFIGGFTDKDLVSYIGPSLFFKLANQKCYNISLTYMKNSTVCLQGGMYWPIHIKRNKR